MFAQRKMDVEPVFGKVKACLGYKRCNLRGKCQVTIDMELVFMANNLLKYSKRMAQNYKHRDSQMQISMFFVAENYFVSDSFHNKNYTTIGPYSFNFGLTLSK